MVRVKICGITRLDDALLATELGATALGFVFWPKSPRAIEADLAAAISEQLPAYVSTVGVFVDQPVDEVRRTAATARLAAIQLHGDEPLDYARQLLQPVIKAVAVDEGFVAESLDAIPAEITVLLDARDPIRRGGTGQMIDWTLARKAAERRPIFLSGGLNPENIRQAIAQVHPYGVDLSSGVESAPGVKDPDRLRAFFGALHDSDRG
ncbi:MAG TPA: phosphoribosylanthranilate isomerase [Vicinamibacterales bacterium]